MNTRHQPQKGQAVVFIALAIVGLVAITALAIDAGNTFLDRRKAQNAADSAATAAALGKIQGQNLFSLARNSAALNGYTTGSGGNTVIVNNPPAASCDGSNSSYVGDSEYIQIIIHSVVKTYFAPIIGINQTGNCVEAISRATPSDLISLCDQNLICALSSHDSDAIRIDGNSRVVLSGGGVFSNSDASVAIIVKSGTDLQISSGFGLTAVGGISVPSGYISPLITGAQQLPHPLPSNMIPTYTCDYNVVDLPQNGKTNLAPGVYCVSGNMKKADYIGNEVTIVMLNNGLDWSGNLNVYLSAPNSGSTSGLLFFFPYGNNQRVKFRGSGTLDMVGTFFAPGVVVEISGDFKVSSIRTQFIVNKMSVDGASALTIGFPSYYYKYPSDLEIELTK